MATLRNRLFVSVSLGHFAIDVLNSLVPVLLAVLSGRFGLSYGRIALAMTLYTFAGSLSQPVFGWLSDRFQGRPTILSGAAMLAMAGFFAAAAVQQHWPLMLACLIGGSLASGLFHPIGTSQASAANRARAGSLTAVFFFCGQIGLAAGPTLGGLLFERNGALGILPLCLVALLPAALMLAAPRAPVTHDEHHTTTRTVLKTGALIVLAFVALVAVRSTIQAAYTAFLPQLFKERGWNAADYGALSGTFMFAAAIGNIVTGIAADRYGMRAATFWPLVLSIPAGLLCLWGPTPLAAFVAAGLAGLLICGQHSVLVVHAQRLLPTKQGFSSGLILGFTFASGGIGTWLAGSMADVVGLPLVMQALTWLAVPAALLALTLPGAPRNTPRYTPDGAAPIPDPAR